MKKTSIIPSFQESIENSTDLACDITSLSIERLTTNEVLLNIPIVKSLKVLYSLGRDIREAHLIKNSLIFLNEMKAGSIDQKKLTKFKNKTLKSQKSLDNELQRIIFILDRTTEEAKACYLGRLFAALLNEKISFDEFYDYSELLEKVYINDLLKLNAKLISSKFDGILELSNNEERYFSRLENNGIGTRVFIKENEKKYAITFQYDEYSQCFANIIFNIDRPIVNNDVNTNVEDVYSAIKQKADIDRLPELTIDDVKYKY